MHTEDKNSHQFVWPFATGNLDNEENIMDVQHDLFVLYIHVQLSDQHNKYSLYHIQQNYFTEQNIV
jgi:hypothetical protein